MTDDATEDKGRVDEFFNAGIQVDNLHDYEPQLRTGRRWGNRLRSHLHHIDVVHIHGVWERVVYEAAAAAQSHGVPYLIRSCGMLDEWSLEKKWLKKRLYLFLRLGGVLKHASGLHCTSEMEAHSTVRAGIRPRQIIIEPNGVATEDFTELPTPGTFRRAHGIGDRPLVTFLGRVHPGKGVEYLLPALAMIETKNVVLAVVGPNESAFAKEMLRQAAKLPAKCEVIFTGMLKGRERVPALVDADVFTLPSEHENFGVAVVEAIAAGCPVVVSKHVGLANEIERRDVGTATSLEPLDIARAIDGWILRERQDTAGRERRRSYALFEYNWNSIAERWLRHYQRLVA